MVCVITIFKVGAVYKSALKYDIHLSNLDFNSLESTLDAQLFAKFFYSLLRKMKAKFNSNLILTITRYRTKQGMISLHCRCYYLEERLWKATKIYLSMI